MMLAIAEVDLSVGERPLALGRVASLVQDFLDLGLFNTDIADLGLDEISD
jgi:hypothetical protein